MRHTFGRCWASDLSGPAIAIPNRAVRSRSRRLRDAWYCRDRVNSSLTIPEDVSVTHPCQLGASMWSSRVPACALRKSRNHSEAFFDCGHFVPRAPRERSIEQAPAVEGARLFRHDLAGFTRAIPGWLHHRARRSLLGSVLDSEPYGPIWLAI